MDQANWHVLSRRLSNMMDAGFCIKALEAALRTRSPEIFNADQGAQFTGIVFTDRVRRAAEARCSVNDRNDCGRLIERLRCLPKYEAAYLRELTDGRAAERETDDWFRYYNHVRPYSSLENRMPYNGCRSKLKKPRENLEHR